MSLLTQLAEDYQNLKVMPNGIACGIGKMVFTTALYVGLNHCGYERRYCYEEWTAAVAALEAWDGTGDPPGPWIKEKPGDRLGPGAVGVEIY